MAGSTSRPLRNAGGAAADGQTKERVGKGLPADWKRVEIGGGRPGGGDGAFAPHLGQGRVELIAHEGTALDLRRRDRPVHTVVK